MSRTGLNAPDLRLLRRRFGGPARLTSCISDQGYWAPPSGKGADFDSAMRRFESSRPSQSSELRTSLCKQVQSGKIVSRVWKWKCFPKLGRESGWTASHRLYILHLDKHTATRLHNELHVDSAILQLPMV